MLWLVGMKEKPYFFCRLLASHFAYTNPIYSITVGKVTILSWDLPTFLYRILAILTLKIGDCSYSQVLPSSSIALPTAMLITWIILGASGVSLTACRERANTWALGFSFNNLWVLGATLFTHIEQCFFKLFKICVCWWRQWKWEQHWYPLVLLKLQCILWHYATSHQSQVFSL